MKSKELPEKYQKEYDELKKWCREFQDKISKDDPPDRLDGHNMTDGAIGREGFRRYSVIMRRAEKEVPDKYLDELKEIEKAENRLLEDVDKEEKKGRYDKYNYDVLMRHYEEVVKKTDEIFRRAEEEENGEG